MPTLQEALEYLDEEFAKAPEEVKRRVVESIKGDPAKIDEAFSYLDSSFAKAPQEVKAKIIASLADVSIPEKLWRAFATGAGELVEDVGGIIKGGVKLLEKGAEAITGRDYEFETPIADKLQEVGRETKEYWTPPKYEEAYDFMGRGFVEEVPSLVGFSPALKVGAKLGRVGAKVIPKVGKKDVTRAVAENVGAGAGYSATQMAAGDYTAGDALTQAGLDAIFGAGGYAVGKALGKVRLGKKGGTESAVEEPVTEQVKLEDAQTTLENIEPPPLPKPEKKLNNPKEALEFFEKELLGKEIETPIGLRVRFDKRHFLNIISGGKKKGFVEGAKTPEESYELIKRGVEAAKIGGFEDYRARTIYLIPDILEKPHVVTKNTKEGRYVFYKEYKVNGTKGYVAVTVDDDGVLYPISFHRKRLKNVLNKLADGEEELVFVARGLSPGRTTPATGYAPGELTDSIKNKIDPTDGGVKFRSGGPSSEELTQAIKKTLEIPEDPLKGLEDVANPSVKEIADLSRERRVTLKSKVGWVLPQYEWMKDHPLTLAVYRSAEQYTEGMEKDLNRWFGRLDELELDNIDPRWRNRVADVVENKLKGAIPEDIKALAQGIRSYLDDIYEYAKSQGLDISYRENYFPHLFEGNIRVQVGKEFRQASSWDEALSIAAEGLKQGKRVKIKAFLRPDIYELKITNPRFWRLISKIEDGVELDTKEISQLVKEAGIGRRPRWRYVGNLLERKYDIEGYIKDPETALKLYTFTILKKIHQDRYLKDFERAYEKVRDPELRSILEDYKGAVLGYPTASEKFTADVINLTLKLPLGRKVLALIGKNVGAEVSPFGVRRRLGQLGYYANYLPDLGFSLSSAFINGLQVAQNAAPMFGRIGVKGGLKYLNGLLRGNKKIKDELYEAGILTEVGYEGMRVFKKPSLKDLPEVPMSAFTGVELMNRATTYGMAKEWALKNGTEGMLKRLEFLGVSNDDPLWKLVSDESVPLEKRAMEFAKEVVNKTQFRYEKYATPKLLRSSWAKVALPYKNFLINQLWFSLRTLKNAPKDPKTALQFYGISLLIAGATAGNPVLAGAWQVLKELYEWKYGEDLEEKLKGWGKVGEILVKGVPATLGLDIRSSVKLDIPNPAKPEEWLGRPLRTLYYLAKGQEDRAIDDVKPRIYKNIEEAMELSETGLLKDKKGRVIGSADWRDAVLRAVGFRPSEYYEFLEKKSLIYDLEQEFKKEYAPILDELADAVVNGDEEAQEELVGRIIEEADRLWQKVMSSEGVTKRKYAYLYWKLVGSARNIDRRAKNRLVPFSSDRKKYYLTQ